MNTTLIATDRLQLREAQAHDAAFFHTLMNDPDWLAFIGDKNITDEQAAARYIREHTRQAYQDHGMGMWVVTLDDCAIGLCGLNQREHLNDVDLGYAFLPNFRHSGYAFESATGVIGYARDVLQLERIIAITVPENFASQRLLERLGFAFAGLPETGRNGERLATYALQL